MIRTQPRKQNIATSTLASLALSFPHFWCGPLSHVGHVFAFVTGGPLASPSDKCKTARSTTISSASSPGSPHQSFAQQPESCIEDPEAPTAIPQVLWTQGVPPTGGVALTIYQAQIGCTRRSSCSLRSPCALAKHWSSPGLSSSARTTCGRLHWNVSAQPIQNHPYKGSF